MRWSGVIGFADTSEEAPSVYVEHITERRYYGDVVDGEVHMTRDHIQAIADSFAFDRLAEGK